ncbi:hypothetical protein KCP70_13570 [Salmonella enterica subsp. enterica]|nr:hypothetical protein KCP70_13570 [Salmonella enterica subsp. enterica]
MTKVIGHYLNINTINKVGHYLRKHRKMQHGESLASFTRHALQIYAINRLRDVAVL